MESDRWPTPEAAALSSFPEAHSRVAASVREGDDAYVLLDVGTDGESYLYGVCVVRRDGGWAEGASGNGPGWTLTDSDRDLGTASAWGEAPDGADRARVAFGGEVRETPVAGGVYLAAWWRVPMAESLPRAEAFRIGGRWVPAPPGR